MITCPECAAGKHGNCDGAAYDPETNQLTTCSCAGEFCDHPRR